MAAIEVSYSPLARAVAINQKVDVTAAPFNAAGDGTTDATGAFCDAINQVDLDTAAGFPACLYIPVGVHKISRNTGDANCPNGFLPPFVNNPGVIGDGPHKSYILLDPAEAGDLFAWDDAGDGASNHAYAGSSLAPNTDQAGAMVRGITVLGNYAAGPVQNAFMFYDRNDSVLMEDVEVIYLNGRCLGIGLPKTLTQAFMRESKFNNVKFRGCGTTSSYQFTASFSANSTTATVVSTSHALAVGMVVQGVGITPGTAITNVSGSTLTFSKATGTSAVTNGFLTAGNGFTATTAINSPVIAIASDG